MRERAVRINTDPIRLPSNRFTWLFLSPSGRVDRAAYFFAGLLLYLCRAFPMYRIVTAETEDLATWWGGAFFLLTIATIYPHIALAIKRLHDMDRPGWFSLLFIVGDFFVFLFLSFVPGTRGPNKYGSQTNEPR